MAPYKALKKTAPILTIFFAFTLGISTGCRDLKKRTQESRETSRVTPDGPKTELKPDRSPQPHPWSFETPEEAIRELAARVEKLDFDGIISLLDPRANIRMEDSRLIAYSQGSLEAEQHSDTLFERLNPPIEKEVLNQIAHRIDDRDMQQGVPERLLLITRVVRTFLTSSPSRPTDCTVGPVSRSSLHDFLQIGKWSEPAVSAGRNLMRAWTEVALGTLKCTHRRTDVVLLKERATEKWIIAQLDDTLPERYAWKYAIPPEDDPFKKSADTPTDPKSLFSRTMECLKNADPECLAPLVDPELFSAREITDVLLTLPPETQKAVAINPESFSFSDRDTTAVFLWRHFLFWTGYLALDWSECKLRIRGADESDSLRKHYSSAWEKGKAPEPTRLLLERMNEVRSVLYSCPKGLQLHLTGVRTKKQWTLLDFGLEQETR